MNRLFVSGVGGESEIKTVVDKIKCIGKITGVEINPEIIEIANIYFKVNSINNKCRGF